MPSVLITGANRGLGAEFVRQYARDGWRVFAACRDPSKMPTQASDAVSLHRLDVTDFSRIRELAKELAQEPIDLLINNAGIRDPADAAPFGVIDYARWETSFRINTAAPAEMTYAFIENVARSRKKTVVTISTSLASLALNIEGSPIPPGRYPIYRTTKTAVNMLMRNFALELRPRGVIVAMLSPGHVRTEMGGPSANLEIEESITGLRRVIDGLTLAQSGQFFFYDGRALPW